MQLSNICLSYIFLFFLGGDNDSGDEFPEVNDDLDPESSKADNDLDPEFSKVNDDLEALTVDALSLFPPPPWIHHSLQPVMIEFVNPYGPAAMSRRWLQKKPNSWKDP